MGRPAIDSAMGDFAAIVLAAGLSRRMGEPKQLMRWGQRTIVEQVVGTLLQAPVDEIVVVVGHRADEVEALVNGVGSATLPEPRARAVRVRTVFNPGYQDGMLSSIKCGVAALADDVGAAFIVLCDQPQLRVATLARLREAYEHSERGLAVPSYQMRRGHPLLVDLRKYRREILAIEGTQGLQTILREHPADILHVEFDDASVLMDMDTQGDYERAAAAHNVAKS